MSEENEGTENEESTDNQGALGGDDGGVSPLTLSDEELLDLPLPEDEPEPKKEEEDTSFDESSEDDGESEDTSDDSDQEDDGNASDEDGSDGNSEDTDDESDKEEKKESSNKSEDKPKKEDKSEETKDDKEPNYKELFNQVIAPFKANNREIKVDSVDDVRQLMQMGANYNKKMAGLKPHLKVIRKLENHGLMDEGKLDFLIDLDKKNPEAITKLIKDSGIDPLNVDVDAKSDYKPNSYNVSDNEALLGEVLDDIKGTETYQDTIEVVTNKWDESSKRIIVGEPEIIRTINGHMASGVYDEIVTVMDKERMLGRLTGLSDLEAYKQTGDAMHAAGQFKSQIAEANAKAAAVKKAPKKDDSATKKRKQAAGGSRSAPGKKSVSDFDPLSLSDEEIEKMDPSQFT